MSIYTLNEIDGMIYNIQQLIQDGAEQEQIKLKIISDSISQIGGQYDE